MIPTLLRTAIQHLAEFESSKEYHLYLCDQEPLTILSRKPDWSIEDQRAALFLFAKYRRILIKDGFDYYAVFPKNKDNHDLADRIKSVYGMMDYLEKTHRVKPPRGFDLMPLTDVEQWVRDKIVEVRISNARRVGNSAAAK